MIRQAEEIDERERKMNFRVQELEGQVSDHKFQVQQQRKRLLAQEDANAALRQRLDEIVDKTRMAMPVAANQVLPLYSSL